MIDNLNYLFIVLLAVFAIYTPPSRSRLINIALCGKFCIFIGLHYFLSNTLGMTDGGYVDAYRSILDISFMFLFLYLGGSFLAFLCFLMAMFHVFNTFIEFDYFLIMTGFQILQLSVAFGGMIYGITTRPARLHVNHTHHIGR